MQSSNSTLLGCQSQNFFKSLSINEAATLAGISRASLYRLIKSGQLPVIKLLNRTLIDQNDLEALITRCKRAV